MGENPLELTIKLSLLFEQLWEHSNKEAKLNYGRQDLQLIQTVQLYRI